MDEEKTWFIIGTVFTCLAAFAGVVFAGGKISAHVEENSQHIKGLEGRFVTQVEFRAVVDGVRIQMASINEKLEYLVGHSPRGK